MNISINKLRQRKLSNFILKPKFLISTLSKKIGMVSMLQKPGESKAKKVTLIPGEGIGQEISSIKIINLK